MAYIVGTDRYQTRMITTSLDDLISKDNSVRVIDSYVESLDLENLGFIEYSGRNRGQSPYRRSDLLKLHIYGYLNKIRSSRALELLQGLFRRTMLRFIIHYEILPLFSKVGDSLMAN